MLKSEVTCTVDCILTCTPNASKTSFGGIFCSCKDTDFLYLGQGWAINSYHGAHESPELCQRATNFHLLRA